MHGGRCQQQPFQEGFVDQKELFQQSTIPQKILICKENRSEDINGHLGSFRCDYTLLERALTNKLK